MAAVKTFDVSGEGKGFKIRMQAGGLTGARHTKPAHNNALNQTEFCQGERKLLV